MKNINAWLLTEGAHGMVSQVEGLAKALNVNFTHKKGLYQLAIDISKEHTG